jgi:hypothetical protein
MRYISLLTLLVATSLAAAEPIIGYATPGGELVLSDHNGPLLELNPVAWGPDWGWVKLKSTIVDNQGSTQATFSGALNPASTPIQIGLMARKVGDRQLQIDAELSASQDEPCTLVALAFTPGQRFRGPGTASILAGSQAVVRDVPFGKEALGTTVTGLRLVSGNSTLSMNFAAPAEIQADGQGRLVLAKQVASAAQRSIARLTIDLPGDLTWYPTPTAVPDPPDYADWFAWQPAHALDDQGALGMRDWFDAINAPAVRDHDRLTIAGKPAKFWGINLTYRGCSPTKEVAESRAKLYAKYGYNAVRLHKYADGPGWAGIQSKTSFAEFDPDALDRMDWQVAKFKEQGIRIKLSPTFGIQLGAGDLASVPYLEEFGKLDPKRPDSRVRATHGSVWFSRELQDLQIRQTTELLKHRNPYTGMTYAEDPVVLVVEMYNEDSALFYGTMSKLQKSPTLRKRAAEAFSDWLAARYQNEAGLKAAWGDSALGSFKAEGFATESLVERTVVPAGNPWFYDPDQINGTQKSKARRLFDTMLFLHETQNAFWDRFVAAMHAVGYQREVLASNWIAGRAFSHYYNLASDARFSMIDRHNYFGGSSSMLASAGSGMLSTGLCQVAGLPFSLSEWIHVKPNEFGIEGPAIIGAYGMGLQGWDVSFMFQNGDDGRFRDRIGKEKFDVVAPHILGIEPLIARQVLRGDVAESTLTAPLKVHLPSLHDGNIGFTESVTANGDVKTASTSAIPAQALAVARCLVEFTDQPTETPVFDLAPFRKDGALTSSTGQLRWYEGASQTSGYFTVNTAATKAVVGFAQDQTFALGEVTITPRSPFAAIYITAAGRSDTDLSVAPRILIGAVARARNTGMKVMDGNVLAGGQPPVIMEPVRADITMPAGRAMVLRALDQDGRRTEAMQPITDGKFSIDGAIQKTIYWELSVD